MTARKLHLLVAVLFTISFISCDVNVPITEMVKARTTIEKARQAMADKYDPDNLNKAVEELNKSHGFVVNKKASDAKAAAIKAIDYAEAAIQTALPKAVDDTLEEAKNLQQEADKLNAEKFAPEQFAAAGAAINETEKFKADNNLWDAFTSVRAAVTAGTQAKEAALAKLPGLTEELDAMKKDVETLNSQKLNEQQKKDLAGASSKLDKAGELLGQNNAKEAAALMSEAGTAIQTVKMAMQKISARDKIAQLRKEVEQLKKQRGSEFAADDIAAITGTLNEAETLLDQEKTDDAIIKISEAEQLLAAAKEKTTRGLALEKARSLEKMLEEARKKDTKNRFKTEIDSATGMVDDGKKLLESGSYAESLAKFEEAETLLNSIGVASEKDRLGEDGASLDQEGKRIYKVIYNKKKRDCLWRIAGKVYKNARLWPLIYVANKQQIKDPDLIFPGQKFVIPEVPGKEEKIEKETKDEGVKEDTGKKAADSTTDMSEDE